MRRPIGVRPVIGKTGAWIGSFGLRHHGDAVFNRANDRAEIAPDAFFVLHLEFPLAVDQIGDRLM